MKPKQQTIVALVERMLDRGKGALAIMKAVARAFPKSAIARGGAKEAPRRISYYASQMKAANGARRPKNSKKP